jgi:hypothetical protein
MTAREHEITSAINLIKTVLETSELSLEIIRKHDSNIIVLRDLQSAINKKYPIEEKWQGKKL